jgi:hypothetical protein
MDVNMGKQHNTFPCEQQEMPVTKDIPEVDQPTDPGSPENPAEDPDLIPEEIPVENPSERPLVDPGNPIS